MQALRVLVFMLRLLVQRDDADVVFRQELADAIVAVTADQHEQNLLASIARWESTYRRDVAECRKKGAAGEVTAWQILARGDAERASLCISLEGDARIALARIRESLKACAALPAAEQLAAYARGRCSSVEGRRLSRVRWVQ